MTKEEAIEQAIGYKKGIQKAEEIINRIDLEHPEYPIPLEMWKRIRTELGKADDFLESMKGTVKDNE